MSSSYVHGTSMVMTLLMSWAAGGVTRAATERDVVVYGATPGGTMAAIAVAREGASVVLLEQTRHVGGMSTSGLNRDEGNHLYRDETFGGLCESFIKRATARSGGQYGQGASTWQPHVAEHVFLKMLEEVRVEVRHEQLLDSVTREEARITSLKVSDGTTYRGKVFIDATYEGDLMAKAGVSYVTGRESRDEYGESLGGIIYRDEAVQVSPYGENGRLLFGVMPGEMPEPGQASAHPTCYNIRLNLTTRDDLRVPLTRPDNYDPNQHELLARCIEAGRITNLRKILGLYGMPGGNVECNNRQFSIVSMSIPGAQTPWSEATFEQREAIHRAYRDYTHGMIWFLQTDPRVPEKMRKEMARYGLCKDEWTDNGHWPWYLYVREARRMRGAYVLTQKDVTEDRTKPDGVHLGSHWIDSHQATRYAVPDAPGFVNEGRLWQKGKIYQIPYRALTPKLQECENLLVPVCVSASHVAFSTIRVEPTWMHLGEAAGIAAAMTAKRGGAVQQVDVRQLQAKLSAAGIPLEIPGKTQAMP